MHRGCQVQRCREVAELAVQVSSNTGSVSLTDEEIGLVGASYNKAWNRQPHPMPH